MTSPISWMNSDSGSDVSSISFLDQEPSSTFRFRVLDFALQNIWPHATAEEINGDDVLGSQNRIVHVSRQPVGQPELIERFVIRIPRYDVGQLNSQLATLRFLRMYERIPAPVNLTFDTKDDNALGSRYILQNFIHGSTLLSSWHSLRQDQRCKVARELGRVYHEPPAPSDVQRFLINVFLERWVILDEPLLSSNAWPALRDQLCRMASEMAAEGWFKDCYVCLAHLNLVPSNVMVDPTDTASPIISAILDCESAVFVPQFMCCQPPMWLWNNGGEQDERLADKAPPTPEG
ncbi:hypothetical protein F5B19DRAFT_448570 [Rostrohypoxylon terebratum]|nr:hypothetical protein F5B19DRAFT_448570 [Rostrohypoxylon terebratum]